MRVNFPMMIAASLALHVGVVTAVALSYWHPTPRPAEVSESVPPTMMLLRQEIVPALPIPSPAPVRMKSVPLETMAAPVAIKVPTPERTVTKGLPVTAPQTAEVNPNAHAATPPPESVLSPTPPPVLDGAKGVVFVLDISGSMYEAFSGTTRLACARQALAQRILALKDGTPFAIALYAQKAYTSGPLVAANNATREAALRFIARDVNCGGGTNLPAGLAAAAGLRAGSIVLVSDGDLNMAGYALMPRVRDILGEAGHGPALTVVAVAPRVNAGDDRALENLAERQGGTYLTAKLDAETAVLSATNAGKPSAQ